MRNILVLDSACYKPYTYTTLLNEGLGGTEASVLRAARIWGRTGYSVRIINGAVGETGLGVSFVTMSDMMPRPDIIVHLRTACDVPTTARAFPGAQQVVWHHDLGGGWVKQQMPMLQDHKVDLVFVSEYHKQQFIDRGIRPYDHEYEHRAAMYVCYNEVDAMPDDTKYEHGRLFFPSSPHKGLPATISVFKRARKLFPELQLRVANPGYFESLAGEVEGVTDLGPIPHAQVLEEMRKAHLVVSANHTFPETQGLVYQEANAVGTPVIAHKMGALPELLDHGQLIDTRSVDKFIRTLSAFLMHRPRVSLNDLCRAPNVARQWRDVFK